MASRVLIIDDNDDERLIFNAAFHYNGFDVSEAATAIDGIEAARNLRPDLIIMDVRLPDMNGLLAAEIIRTIEGYETIPVICVTGLDLPPDVAIERGCDVLMHKPIVPHALIATALKLLTPPQSA